MKRTIFISMIITVLVLSACSAANTPTPIPTISLGNDNTAPNNNQSSDANSVSASAIIAPVTHAKVSAGSVGRITEVNVKVGDLVNAGDLLARLDTTILEAKVREAEANLKIAQIQVKYLKRIGTNEAHLDTAIAESERTQALLDLANANLASQSILTAPISGTVISVDIAPAETVAPGQVVITLADLSHYQIETTDLSERDVTRVQIGQTARVFIEALGEEFTGKVTDIDRIGSTLGGDVVFTVKIDLDNQPKGLLWGMSADVTIETK
jgi:RND family efflux transporter MFP subunit